MKKLSTLFAFAFALSLTAPVLAEETANAPAKEEKGAGEKKKEDVRGLVSAAETALGRYGRLNVQFGELLTIDGVLAAYVIALIDGTTYRVLDGRMNTDLSAYSPGRILESAVLERALEDGETELFDWMTGVAPETILAANVWQPRWSLVAGAEPDSSAEADDQRPVAASV